MYDKITIKGKPNELMKICEHLELNGYNFETLFYENSVNVYILADEVEYVKTILSDNNYVFEVEGE